MEGYGNYNVCSISSSYSLTSQEVIVIQQGPPILSSSPFTGQGHSSQHSCPCREENKVLQETIKQLSKKVEKQDEMLLKLKSSFDAYLSKEKNNVQKVDKGSQGDRQSCNDLNATKVTVADSAETKGKRREDLTGGVIIEEIQDGNGDKKVRFFRGNMATTKRKAQAQPLKITKVKKTIENNDNEKDVFIIPDKEVEEDSSKTYPCTMCSTELKNKRSLRYHLKRHANPVSLVCEFCFKKYKSTSILGQHKRSVHRKRPCPLCTCEFRDISSFNAHMKSHNQAKIPLKLLPVPARPNKKSASK